MTEQPDRADEAPAPAGDEALENDHAPKDNRAPEGDGALEDNGALEMEERPLAEIQAAINEFWTWWEGYADQASAQLESGDEEPVEAELTPRVRAIHPALAWEIGQPEEGRYSLTLSGGGLPALRAVTERWLRAGGKVPGRFEFHAAQQADPEMLTRAVELDGHELDFSHIAFGVRFDNRRIRFDVSVYHPDFLFISEEEQLRIAALALRWTLGEDDVARWIGLLVLAEERPADALAPAALRVVVNDVAGGFVQPRWAQVTGQSPEGKPLEGEARFPLRRVDHPLFEQHIALAVPYKQKGKDGQPGKRSLTALRGFEELLDGVLGADAILAAHVTAEGTRVFHLYADPGSDVAGRIEAVSREWEQGKPHIQVSHDPNWNAIAPFLT